MATASLTIPSRPALPWRIMAAVAALVVAGLLVFSTTVGFTSSSSSATTSTATTPHAVTPDALDRVTSAPPATTASPDSIDRVGTSTASNDSAVACRPGKPC